MRQSPDGKRVYDIQFLVQNGLVTLKGERPSKELVLQEEREPEAVVLPHSVQGNGVFGEPLRAHLLRLDDGTLEDRRGEDVHFQHRRLVHEFEEEETDLTEVTVGHLTGVGVEEE